MNQRKRNVLQAALQLFTEKGFQNTSIQDIITHANISKGTFYNYFSSKNECFLAILENSRYEASLRRHELLDGEDPANLTILAKQVAVLMEIYQEQNITPLFEGVFQSHDKELKLYLTQHRMYEVQWMTTRLIDVYGEQARPYAYEAAVLFFGMMQHTSLTYRLVYGTTLNPLLLAEGIMRHLNVILLNMMEHGEVLLKADAIHLQECQLMMPEITVESILERLSGFLERLPQEPNVLGEQFTVALIEELERKLPRLAIIEVLVKPFREAFGNTVHEVESRELAHLIWSYVTQLKKT